MVKVEMYVDSVINEAIARFNWLQHVKTCDICLNYAISDESEPYTLKCVYGWICLEELVKIVENQPIDAKHRI